VGGGNCSSLNSKNQKSGKRKKEKGKKGAKKLEGFLQEIGYGGNSSDEGI